MNQIQMIKINGKFVPAEKNEEGRWIPIENAELQYTGEGLKIVKKEKKENESDIID